ncbi:MAG: 4Fe-4S binding protein [Candidatus Thorarchaeota archaeon]|nr:4Fe-4S binding protein [Candidatus Thorarchaeota archaeon]
MKENEKSIEEINIRIADGNARVVTADEMVKIVAEMSVDEVVHEVDVVTTGTFGAMCSSGVWMNFGHSEPPMKMSRVWLNDVEAYSSVAAVDAYLGATQPSRSLGIEYGGGHVIEDLVRGRSVRLEAEGTSSDCYPLKSLSADIKLEDMNQAIMSNPRNCYERYGAATNTSDRAINTYMGRLLPSMGNATYSGAGELSPIINDPTFQTVGIGTRILLGGTEGYVIGSGTQHNPSDGFGILMVQGNLKQMSPEFLRGATLTGYGPTLYVGVGVPIPVINAEVVRSTAVADGDIVTDVYDYGIQSRDRPTLAKVTYEELKSGMIEINGTMVQTSALSSFRNALMIARRLRDLILQKKFFLTEPVELLKSEGTAYPMRQRVRNDARDPQIAVNHYSEYYVQRDETNCVHCGLCVPYCSAGVFQQNVDWTVSYEPSRCVECGECRDVCPQRAIHLRG